MKHIALAGLFALVAPAVAQEGGAAGPKWSKEARLAIAEAIAAEEQENDLAKAQRLYRAALQDAERSAEAKSLAAYRLAALLRRLGKDDEARAALKLAGKGQVVSLDDVTNGQINQDRVKELRKQARDLVQRILDKDIRHLSSDMRLIGVDNGDADQLFWIGQPAVVEVVAALQEEMKKPYGGRARRVPGLVQLLWMSDTPVATRFLLDAIEYEVLVELVAKTARSAKRLDLDAPAIRALVEHEDHDITKAFLVGDGLFNGAAYRLTNDQVLTISEAGSVKVQALLFPVLARRTMDAKQLKRAHALARGALRGADPECGKAAELFVASTTSQQSLEGLQMLFERLPEFVERRVPLAGWSVPGKTREFLDAEVAALLPALDSVAAEAPYSAGSSATRWMLSLMLDVIKRSEPGRIVEHGLRWHEAGYPTVEHLACKATRADVAGVLDCLPGLNDEQRRRVLVGLPIGSVGPDSLAKLVAYAPALARGGQNRRFGMLVASVGSDEAVDWLMRHRSDAKARFSDQAHMYVSWIPEALLEIGRTNQSERVRSAMHNTIRGFAGPRAPDVAAVMLALMSMSDERTLDFLGVGTFAEVASRHPYGESDAPRITPMAYLLNNGSPRHRYTEDQVLAVIRAYYESLGKQATMWPVGRAERLSDRVLLAIAELDPKNYNAESWLSYVMARLSVRIQEGGDVSLLDPWLRQQFGRKGRPREWMANLPRVLFDRYRDLVLALIDGDDSAWAVQAIQCANVPWAPVDLAAALSNRHARVRQWAIFRISKERPDIDAKVLVPLLKDEIPDTRAWAARLLGDSVSKEAVPALIEALRDPSVSKLAADALTKIRFYHEQQAHWDRVLKGMDASPESAVEKLLLQARPDQGKQQRLLAIPSLGVLGKPEALPFLIEWAQEKDADIANAARSAIQKVHLDPHK